MAQVKKGSKVLVHYRGRLKDNTEFEHNYGGPPLEFKVGGGKVIPGFEKAVIGMNLGQVKTVVMKPGDAYGPRDESLVWQVSAVELPEGSGVGAEVDYERPDGNHVQGVVTGVEGESATIDGNHPLAGKSLTFEIKLVGVK